MAEGGNVDVVLAGRLEDGLVGARADFAPSMVRVFTLIRWAHACTSAVGDRGIAHPGRASFLFDVGQVFVLEVAQGAEDRVRGRLAQAAEAGVRRPLRTNRSRRSRSRWVASPLVILVSSSYICAVPARQGMHLPQDSVMQNSMKKRATYTMQDVSSMTIMPPEPIMEPALIKTRS